MGGWAGGGGEGANAMAGPFFNTALHRVKREKLGIFQLSAKYLCLLLGKPGCRKFFCTWQILVCSYSKFLNTKSGKCVLILNVSTVRILLP
jgi:hypothetical protein